MSEADEFARKAEQVKADLEKLGLDQRSQEEVAQALSIDGPTPNLSGADVVLGPKETISETMGRMTPGLGFISGDMGHGDIFSAAQAVVFKDADDMNEWFRVNGFGKQLAAIHSLGERGILALLTKTLSDEEQQEYTDIQHSVNELMEQKKAARKEAAERMEEAKKKAREEVEATMKLGEQCKKNHAGVIDDNHKLRKLVKRMRKALAQAGIKLKDDPGEEETDAVQSAEGTQPQGA